MAETQTTEMVYFDSGDVKVTNARFIVPAQTYAMRNVTSVAFGAFAPNRFWPLVWIIVGLILAVVMKSFWPVVIFILPAGFWLLLQKPMYAVMLNSASGESRALQSQDSGYVKSVVEALNQAIVARG